MIVNVIADFWRGMPHISHTCAARAGVSYLSKSLGVEWAEHNIRINCVAPGTIETEGLNVYPPEVFDTMHLNNPMKHMGDVMDVAEAVVYLGSQAGKFISGETLTVDGGQFMWGDTFAMGTPAYFQGPNEEA